MSLYRHLSIFKCPSVYDDCCLTFYQDIYIPISICSQIHMFLSPYTPMSLCPYISICHYVPSSLCPYNTMYLYISMSLYLFVPLSIYPYVLKSSHMSLCHYVSMSLCLFVHMSHCTPYILRSLGPYEPMCLWIESFCPFAFRFYYKVGENYIISS